MNDNQGCQCPGCDSGTHVPIGTLASDIEHLPQNATPVPCISAYENDPVGWQTVPSPDGGAQPILMCQACQRARGS